MRAFGRKTRRLVWTFLFMLLVVGATTSGVDGAPQDERIISEMIAALEKYERSFWGYEVEVDVSSFAQGKLTVAISRDGGVQIWEGDYLQPYALGTEKESYFQQKIGSFSNSTFSLTVFWHAPFASQPETTRCVGRTDLPNASWASIGKLCGFVDEDLEFLSALVGQSTGTPSVSQGHAFGKEVRCLKFAVSGKGKYSILFSEPKPGKFLVEGYEVAKERGDVVRRLQGDEKVGQGSLDTFSSQKCIVGPITYDRQGIPVEAAYVQQATISGEPKEIKSTMKLRRYWKLSRSLSPDRVVFSHLDYPDTLPVTMTNTSVPHVLVDQRLVSYHDGAAVEAAMRARFHDQGGWWRARHYWILGILLLIVTGILIWQRSRRS